MDGIHVGLPFVAAVLLLLAPGCALLAWLPHDSPGDSSEQPDPLSIFADAAALSIVIPGLLALALFILGLRAAPQAVGAFYGLSLLLLLAAIVRGRVHLLNLRQHWRWWIGCLAAAIFVASLVAWRLYQARTLALPSWVDSVHHTLVVRKIYEYGGLPPDLNPYLNIPFFYHYGFHLITALFAFWANASPDQAVLWFGQIINALVALSVYRAARAVAGSRTISGEEIQDEFQRFLAQYGMPILAALLAGFVLQMPAYYLTWGRYTLLAGLLLLGSALAAAMEAWENPRRRAALVKLAMLVAGLCFTHYFALLLAGLALVVIGLFGLIQGIRSRVRWKAVAWLVGAALLGILLASPWIGRVWYYNHQQANVQVISPLEQTETAQQNAASYLKYLVSLIGPKRNRILFGMAGVGLLFALRWPRLRPLAAWAVLLGLFSLPWGLRFAPFRPDHFAIVLFFPATIFLAQLLTDGAAALGSLTRPWLAPLAFVVAAGLFAIWGIRETSHILNAATIFASQADVQALQWVQTNTPPDARFFINSIHWQGNIERGIDGGYWLLPYTGRASLVPPALYVWGNPNEVNQINDWAKRAEKMKGCTPDFWSLARDARLTYIYLREGKGSLQPDMLADCARLRLVYRQQGVFIYEVLRP